MVIQVLTLVDFDLFVGYVSDNRLNNVFDETFDNVFNDVRFPC